MIINKVELKKQARCAEPRAVKFYKQVKMDDTFSFLIAPRNEELFMSYKEHYYGNGGYSVCSEDDNCYSCKKYPTNKASLNSYIVGILSIGDMVSQPIVIKMCPSLANILTDCLPDGAIVDLTQTIMVSYNGETKKASAIAYPIPNYKGSPEHIACLSKYNEFIKAIKNKSKIINNLKEITL